ncbi:putative nuclease HARBI1 [Saccostrea cucullata]|uniref:putative nuclease HARBI1 n=1 Tax=Saccostrea cuccullata TaxID=36930 RepID=UPI002ED397B0
MTVATVRRLQLLQYLGELEQNIAENDEAIAHLLHNGHNGRPRRQRRRYWIRPWITRRTQYGHFDRLMKELETEDVLSFKNFLRVEPDMFRELVDRLSPRLQKQDTWFRKALEPGLKLAITLWYLATGESYTSLMYGFRVPHNTISLLIREVCESIIAEYADEVIACPTTTDEWQQIAEQFKNRWNLDHVLGALDGKHIAIKCPRNGGSLYYNYKGFHSLILMGLVDADYKFIGVDIGANGSASDATVFNNLELKDVIENQNIGFPEADPLPNDNRNIPYFIVGDDAFPLRTWLMKPFARRTLTNEERIFNYRLSRARRVVENAFGILANRWQCLLAPMHQEPETVSSMVLACCCLHNLMRMRFPNLQNENLDQEDLNHHVVPGAWRNCANLTDLDNVGGCNRATIAAKTQRLYLKHYYNSPVGAVPWQNDMI